MILSVLETNVDGVLSSLTSSVISPYGWEIADDKAHLLVICMYLLFVRWK